MAGYLKTSHSLFLWLSIEHALSCPKGGFPIMRHNGVRDLTANLIAEVCHDVCIEPALQLVTDELLSGASAITEDGARLDVAASGFWGGCYERAFFDVRIFNHHAASNPQPISTCYRKHENTKSEPMNSVSGRLNMDPSPPLYCLQQEAWEMLLPFAKRGWPL